MGASTLQKTKVVATKIEQSGSDIRITYLGGTNENELSHFAITAPNGSVYITVSTAGTLAPSGTTARPDVGTVMILHGAGTADNDRVIVVGHFNDGAIQVLLDKMV
ncbi:MAG: hypothetical protein WC620_06615 [Methanoregula sp.]|jgi:hypothetical protein